MLGYRTGPCAGSRTGRSFWTVSGSLRYTEIIGKRQVVRDLRLPSWIPSLGLAGEVVRCHLALVDVTEADAPVVVTVQTTNVGALRRACSSLAPPVAIWRATRAARERGRGGPHPRPA